MNVLVVEDNNAIRRLVHDKLEGHGLAVTTAATAAGAMDVLARRTFDVVILDLTLPDGSGLDVLDSLRSGGSDVHVIVLSGATAEVDRVGALSRGADDYVVKPFFIRELAARVLAAARRHTPKQQGNLTVGELQINLRARVVLRNQSPVDLTAKEFDLLAFLAARPGEVFSRDELLRAVWDSSSEWQQAATITEHIRRLRAKVEADPAHPEMLLTVRGAGYRLLAESAEQASDHQGSKGEPVGSVIQADGVIVHADQDAADFFGYDSPDQMVGLTSEHLVSPRSMDAALRRFERSRVGSVRSEALWFRRASGSEVLLDIVSATTDWQGKPAQLVTFTPSAEASDRLLHLATGVFSESTDALLVTDLNFHIRSWNHAAERMYGWQRDDVLGRHVLDVLPSAGDTDTTLGSAWQELETRGHWKGKVRHIARDGLTIALLASISVVRDDAGDRLGLVATMRRDVPSVAAPVGPVVDDEIAIRHGIDQHEFTVYYQPILNLEKRSILGVEALLRWNHPELGLLHPAAFMEPAESTGLIVQLGNLVLQEAARQTALWSQEGFDLDISVNLSARQLADPMLVDRVVDALATSGLRPSKLVLEVTETTLVEDVAKAAEVLQLLVLHGARIAIDDFGTGWASLTYLKTFPVHALKIDRSFVAGIDRVQSDAAIVRSIVSLADELSLDVVAEGIETPGQEGALRALGCRFGQGFLYDAPMPASELTVSLGRRKDAWEPASPSASDEADSAAKRPRATGPVVASSPAATPPVVRDSTGRTRTRKNGRETGVAMAEPVAPTVLVNDRAESETISNLRRGLLRIDSAHAAAELLQLTVRRFGATLVSADEAGPDALPIDVSLGEGPPVLPAANPLSVTRLQLERVLPMLVEDARHAVDLLRQTERLEEENDRDPLTGLATRRVLDRVLPRATTGVLVMIDLDHFKQVNSSGGHAAGDAVLAAFGATLRRTVRAGDTSCRIGGDEFALVATGLDVVGGMDLVERIRAMWSDARPQRVTFSAGLAAVAAAGSTAAMLEADRALYLAKSRGRDRTETSHGGQQN